MSKVFSLFDLLEIKKEHEDIDWLNDVEKSDIIGSTRNEIVKIRENQGVFRKRILKKYKKCCLCDVSNQKLLIASHIKPWTVSDEKEKVEIYNGLLLCPNHDRLFDRGYIGFDENGKIIISSELNESDKNAMNIDCDMKINIDDKSKKYLKYHLNNIFKG